MFAILKSLQLDLEKNNIKITDASGKTIAVTNDENAGIVNGSDYTHRQEFGIHQGMWWNKTGDKLLYYRKDETMVTNYPLVDFGARVAAVKDIRYPMAGMKSEEVTLVIFDPIVFTIFQPPLMVPAAIAE